MVGRVQIKRTGTPNAPPTGLLPGELAVEMATPLRLWVGVPAALDPALQKLLVDGRIAERIIELSQSPYTWNKPAGLRYLWIRAQGSGGAGGGAAGIQTTAGGQGPTYSAAGAGGGSGAYAERLMETVLLSNVQTVSIGAGGTGVNGANGGNGIDTSFGVHVVVAGGFGGVLGAAFNVANSNGGAAGGPRPTTGVLRVEGTKGYGGMANLAAGIVLLGKGAEGRFGGSASYRAVNGSQPGEAATGYGAGGSGAVNIGNVSTAQGAKPGGNGAPGFIHLTEIF